MTSKLLEYSSEEDEEEKLHYDKRSIPLKIEKADAITPTMITFSPIRILHAGRFSQTMIVRTSSAVAHDILCMKHLMRRKKEAMVAFENELSVYRHADSHPSLFTHILPLIDYHRSVGVSYIVTELGGPNLNILRSNILQRHFSLDSAMRLSVQALEGIQALHRGGILHLAIQPTNMIIGFGANSCNLYLIGFTAMRRTDSTKKRSCTHYPHPVYAPIRIRKEPTMLDDLEGWLYTTMDLLGRPQYPWMEKKWSTKYREREMNELSDEKRKMFTDEKFASVANMPDIMKDIGKLIQQSEAADFDTHHDSILDKFRKWLTDHELDMHATYEWEIRSFQQAISAQLLGPFEKEFIAPYYSKMQKRAPKKAKASCEEVKNGKFDDTDEEMDYEEKKSEEKIEKMVKNMKKLVDEILKGPIDVPEDEEDSARE